MSLTIAASLDDALAALAAGARPIAGGTDLVVGARHGKVALPDTLVAIDRIIELTELDASDTELRLGATVSHHRLEIEPSVVSGWTALADACALVGSPATRHVGTIGGNVMNASPAMDTGAPLVVFGATVELRSQGGVRNVSLSDLWTGPGRTSARPTELCVAVRVPALPTRSGSAYLRLEYRRAMEIAVAGAAAAVTLDANGSISALRVALSAVAPSIIELHSLPLGTVDTVADAAAALAAEQCSPITDVRASDRYRRHTVGVMAGRAVRVAARRAAGEVIGVPAVRHTGIGAAS